RRRRPHGVVGVPDGRDGRGRRLDPASRGVLRGRDPDQRPRRQDPRPRRAGGVALESGEEIRAPVVVTTIHPKIAFLKLLDRSELPPEFVRDIEIWKTRSGVVKINLAMSELPDFIADPGKELQDHHTGSVELCFSAEYA